MWIAALASLAHAQDLTDVDIGVDLLPMVGTSAAMQGSDRRAISLGLLGTYAGAVDGVELSLGLNIDRLSMDGVQWGAFGNLVGTDVDGVQLAGGLNLVGGSVDGIQLSSGVSLVGGSVDGVQAAGGANITALDVDGMQVAGGLNITGGVVNGVQAAGGLNIAGGIDGLQVAPLNYTTGHVDGVQLGVINIARTSDLSLGVINIIWNGRTHLDAWADESGFGYAAFKHGGERFHYIYAVGYRPAAPDLPSAWLPTIGFGGHAPGTGRLFADLDVMSGQLLEGVPGLNLKNTGRVVGGLRLFGGLALTAGVSYNVLVTETCGPKYAGPGAAVFTPGPVQVRGWPGWMVGVELL